MIFIEFLISDTLERGFERDTYRIKFRTQTWCSCSAILPENQNASNKQAMQMLDIHKIQITYLVDTVRSEALRYYGYISDILRWFCYSFQ